MQLFKELLVVWIGANVLVGSALYFRLPRPNIRARMLNWIVRNDSQPRAPTKTS
jgi:hypothetical protein